MLITPDKFERSLTVLSQAKVAAVDTETYWATTYMSKRIIGVSVYCEVDSKYFNAYYPFRHECDDGENLKWDFFEDLTDVLNTIELHVFHGAKFDRSRWELEKLKLTSPFICTMVGSHMVDENVSHELEDQAEMYGIDNHANRRKAHLHDLRKKILWHKIPLSVFEPYACGDTRNTYKLWPRVMVGLRKQQLDHLWQGEEDYCKALMDIELNGIKIKPKLCRQFSHEASVRMYETQQELGFNPAGKIDLADKLFNELKLPILERGKPSKRWPQGMPTMNEPTLQKLAIMARKTSPEAVTIMQKVLDYRGDQKAKGTWYDGWVELLDSDGRLHPTFQQHGTVTTRLSANTPNVEQIPRDIEGTPVKKTLDCDEDFELWEADYSQLEYRFAGAISGEAKIIDAYRQGADFHDLTAHELKIPRQSAKVANFLLIFLGGVQRLVDVFGFEQDYAREFHRRYRSTYPTLFAFAEQVNHVAAQRGYIKLWDGRRRHFRFQFECKKAWNSLVQGGSATICKHGILRIWRDQTIRARMNNQVHDALWFEIESQLVHTELAKIRYHMEWPSRDPRFKVPFPVEVKRLAAA